MSKLVDLLNNSAPATSKANTKGVDKTPIDAQKEPFAKSKDLVNSDLTKPRGGEFGSFPGAPAGFKPAGYGPGESAYSKKVPKR
jgi:hypothetical protein